MRVAEFPARVRRSLAARYETYRWRAFEAVKPRYRRRFGAPKATVFVFGCQRSGTTHLERLFRADPRSVVHGEFSDLSIRPDKTVWRPFDEMDRILNATPGAYVVARSLLASHLVPQVMDRWPTASAVWMFRDANAVVDSMMRKWGDQFHPISERVESGADGSWDLRALWADIETEARARAPEATGDQRQRDIYALFWLRRNQLVFDLALPENDRVILADYKALVRDPVGLQNQALRLAGAEPARWRYPLETRGGDPRSKPKPRFSDPIQADCDALYSRLCTATDDPS